MYYFPSPITDFNFPKKNYSELVYTFNSGKNALQFLLHNLNLSVNSKVAIPSYVCREVRSSVEAENLVPVLFDLKDDSTFWTHYDTKRLKQENIKLVILVHLYGFIHPDTNTIMEFCKQENILLIHDAAQSFGIDEQKLGKNIPVVYSFGAGKATTAAGGGWIKKTELPGYAKKVAVSSMMSFQNIKAIYFLKARIFNFILSKRIKLINAIVNFISGKNDKISGMTRFQKHAASFLLSEFNNINTIRKENYKLINNAIQKSNTIKIAYDDSSGIYFKAVLFIKTNPDDFRNYLFKNEIPYFSLFTNEEFVSDNYTALPNHRRYARHFVELSAESSIPQSEIQRVAKILMAY